MEHLGIRLEFCCHCDVPFRNSQLKLIYSNPGRLSERPCGATTKSFGGRFFEHVGYVVLTCSILNMGQDVHSENFADNQQTH